MTATQTVRCDICGQVIDGFADDLRYDLATSDLIRVEGELAPKRLDFHPACLAAIIVVERP